MNQRSRNNGPRRSRDDIRDGRVAYTTTGVALLFLPLSEIRGRNANFVGVEVNLHPGSQFGVFGRPLV